MRARLPSPITAACLLLSLGCASTVQNTTDGSAMPDGGLDGSVGDLGGVDSPADLPRIDLLVDVPRIDRPVVDALAGDLGSVDSSIVPVDVPAPDVPVADVPRIDRPFGDAGRRRSTMDVNGDGFADVLVGAPWAFRSGAMSLYLGGEEGLAAPSITLTVPYDVERFGNAVAFAGDVNRDGFADILVGTNGSHTAYLYYGAAAGLAPSPMALDGPAAGLSRDLLVEGAGDVNGDGFSDVLLSGDDDHRGYLYLGGATGIATTPTILTAPGTNRRIRFIRSVGDVNGDGFSDLISGTYSDTPEESFITYLYLGAATGLATTPTIVPGLSGSGAFGDTIAGGTGDVNGDGFADVIVGRAGPTVDSRGTVRLYLGGTGGLATTATSLPGLSTNASYLFVIENTGDVNGDGFADVLMGGRLQRGILLYLGDAEGLATIPTPLISPSGGVAFNEELAGAGDVNGDGFADALAGSPRYDRVYLYLGGTGGFVTPPTTLTGEGDFGTSVASVGDVNDDRFAALVRSVGGSAVEELLAPSDRSAGGWAVAPLRFAPGQGLDRDVAGRCSDFFSMCVGDLREVGGAFFIRGALTPSGRGFRRRS